MRLLKAIALLLDYPDEALWQEQKELTETVSTDAPGLVAFLHDYFASMPLDKQASWCETFERGRATSLLLFEHVHGESRDRGQAMVDLLSEYERAGLSLNARELPDYLPLYLEYLGMQSHDAIQKGLTDIAPILALIGARLKQRNSAFFRLFDELLRIASSPLNSNSEASRVASETRDDSPEALDAVWEEEQVKFSQAPALRAVCKSCAPLSCETLKSKSEFTDLSAKGA